MAPVSEKGDGYQAVAFFRVRIVLPASSFPDEPPPEEFPVLSA